MGQDSKIEWCDDTVNLWHGCTKVSPACTHCYAESISKRVGRDIWGDDKERFIRTEKALAELDKINKRAEREGRIRRVFINSMSDFFEDREDLIEPRRRFFDLVAGWKWIEPLVLTKRPENITRMVPTISKAPRWQYAPTGNLRIGMTGENQEWANKRFPHLHNFCGRTFVSIEPLLGPIDIDQAMYGTRDGGGRRGCSCFGFTDGIGEEAVLSWVIVGSESGHHSRPMSLDWARDIRDQCKHAHVPFFMKQITDSRGNKIPFDQFPEDLRIRQFPEAQNATR